MESSSSIDASLGLGDLAVIVAYLLGMLAIGGYCARRNRNSHEMFAAGGRSPWWVAGVSGFMTMFSAGTFVVWGGIAYRYGLVAVVINLCYGVSALLVGRTVASRWRSLGVRTPAEYVSLRFGRSALHFYTWSLLSFKLVSAAVALYSLAVLVDAVIGEHISAVFGDAGRTLPLMVAVLGSVIVIYTVIGGLWGVLVSDFVQFVVLTVSVLAVVPLALAEAGGVSTVAERIPAGFLNPVAANYTWVFLAGWIVIHYFVVGAEWAFVQRYLCVPNERDAAKAAYLFGGLYIVSPLIWLLPPMIYRTYRPLPDLVDSAATATVAESAYIDVCLDVLPSGLLGLAVAAMFSATASMLSSQLNVFAGVLTSDILRPLLGDMASEGRLVWCGRAATAVVGSAVVLLALLVPTMGGAEAVIVSATSLAVVPLLAPLLVGVISKRLPVFAVWATVSACSALIVWAKVLAPLDPSAGWNWPITALQGAGDRLGCSLELTLGVIVPTLILAICVGLSSGVSPGWLMLDVSSSSRRRHEGT